MIKITSIHNPAIAVLNGRTLVMPTWTVVPDGTTLDDIDWIRPVQVKAEVKRKHVGKYIVNIYEDGRVTCDCPGFTYRKKCKHSAEYLA
jgi:hypothetical protein